MDSSESTVAAWRAWVLAARPKTLFAGICPVLIGTSLAVRDNQSHAPSAIAALLGAISIQIGTNFCNDYFDFRQGADTVDRKGPRRAVQAGWIRPSTMSVATILAYSLAFVISVGLASRAGWPLALLGVISIGCGVWYTASRFSLAYLGLGDLFVFIFFGPVAVAGTHFVQSLRLSPAAVVAGIAPGLISVGILVINNLRDIQEDTAARKRTMAVRFGPRFTRIEYRMCLIGAMSVPPVLTVTYGFPIITTLASLAIVPGLILASKLATAADADFNQMLARTALVLLAYSIVFSVICVVS